MASAIAGSFKGRVLLPDAETGDLDMSLPPPVCGVRPRVRRRGLINYADIHPCVTRLLAETYVIPSV